MACRLVGTQPLSEPNAILTFSFKKGRLGVSSAKWRPFWLGRSVLIYPSLMCELWNVYMYDECLVNIDRVYIYDEISEAYFILGGGFVFIPSRFNSHRRIHMLHVVRLNHEHDDVIKTFSALLALCAGNSPVPVNFPHNGQWRGALMFSLICVWINDWVNNREAGDLRRHCGHYDVNVMILSHMIITTLMITIATRIK